MIIKKEIVYSCLVLIIGAGIILNTFFFKVVKVNDELFLAKLALNSETQKKGLGGKEDLCSKCAMLFDFKKKSEHAFWMKDMRFDLDIIWIAGDEIIYIRKNFSHRSSETINPKIKADKVLEIGAGLSDEYGFKIGDKVKTY